MRSTKITRKENVTSRKARKNLAELYIDDQNFRGIRDWYEIFYKLHPEEDKTAVKKRQ